MRLFSRRPANNRESLDGDYVLPDKPIYNTANTSKLMLPFKRKPTTPDTHISIMSDSGHDLPPPPPKSSLFNRSVHSLPNDSASLVRSDTPSSQKKSPSLFSWARERTKSKPQPAVDPASFNLKAFRHVRPDSPASPPEQPLQPLPDTLLAPPRPRPRGDSVASDSSQRISVAAFREAHARTRANSPVPSFRPPSTADTLRVDSRKRASTVSVVSGSEHPLPNKTSTPMPGSRPGTSTQESSSDTSDSSDDEDVDSDGEPIPKTAQRRAGARPSQSPSVRKRASVSTSALTPTAAARRASILAGTNSSSSSHAHQRHPLHKQQHDSSSDTDSEDVPLSGLVAPQRPGSSASNGSNNRPRIPPKPLIDINTLAGGPPLLTPILRHENSVKDLHKDKEPGVEMDLPFSVPAVLAQSASPSPPISPSVPITGPASTAQNRRSTSDPMERENDDDLIDAIRLVGALDNELNHFSVKPPSDRIIPTPIRAREPPTSFTVLSRPPHRQSTAETSSSLSPTSSTHFSISPAVSPQPEIGARQRASTMINATAQKDKSDTVSVSSAARPSVSRTARIPSVPLIHSIPNAPSLKDPGRLRSVSGTSAPNMQGRTQPTPPIPPMPSMAPGKTHSQGFQPSSVPQRPFASNGSVRGDSPAGSSTGDSSSGRAPFTPRDGSDVGMRSKDDASDQGSTLKARHVKKPSVTFEDEHLRERAKTEVREQRTRERRRSEAKAALELGKIVNGRRPLVKEDEDEDVRCHPTINVTMENEMAPNWSGWPMASGMNTLYPSQFGNDSAYFAAHQRALFFAKQAYQMAVAQHAMQVAGEEWERSSNAGFGSGGSVYGGGSGGSVYGGGSGGSVYGASGGSVYGGVGGSMAPMGMMGMPSMGMLMPPNPWGARSSIAFPSTTASVYGGISSSQSEYGGAGWGTQSVYGDAFGPLSSRTTLVGSSAPSSVGSTHGARPRASTHSQPPRVPGKSAARKAAPPSSWKSGR